MASSKAKLTYRDVYARRIIKESLPTAADLPLPIPPPPPGSPLDMPPEELESHLTEVVDRYKKSAKETYGDKKTFPGEVGASRAIKKVGIIGAGCAGLYTAMILESLGIEFEILEGSDRVGGRLHTRKLGNGPNDYYVCLQ